MKKKNLLIFLIVFALLTTFADSGSFYWYRSSTGETVEAFPDVGEDPGDVIQQPLEGDYYLLTVTGYDLSNNVQINGDVAVYKTETTEIKTHQPIFGDIIVDTKGLINNYTLDDLDKHNPAEYTAYQTELKLPICACSTYGPYDKKAVDISDKKKEIKINNGAIVDRDICVPNGYTLFINGNSVINGDIIAPDSPLIKINGNTTVNGKICAPNSTLDVKGQAQIKGPIYVYFLTMNNGTLGLAE